MELKELFSVLYDLDYELREYEEYNWIHIVTENKEYVIQKTKAIVNSHDIWGEDIKVHEWEAFIYDGNMLHDTTISIVRNILKLTVIEKIEVM